MSSPRMPVETSPSPRELTADEDALPVITPESWLELVEQYGVKITQAQLMRPHSTPKDRAIAATDILDKIVVIGECTGEAIDRIREKYFAREQIGNHSGNSGFESATERLRRLLFPSKSTFLYTLPPAEREIQSGPFTITGGDLLRLIRRWGVTRALELLMVQHIAPQARLTAAQELLEILCRIRRLADEGVTRLWDNVITNERLLDEFGGKSFEFYWLCDEIIIPARERHNAAELENVRAREIIKNSLGDNGERMLDPMERRMRHASVAFLTQLAAMVEGWSSPEDASSSHVAGRQSVSPAASPEPKRRRR